MGMRMRMGNYYHGSTDCNDDINIGLPCESRPHGWKVGMCVGDLVGAAVGLVVGSAVGKAVGAPDGDVVGDEVGAVVLAHRLVSIGSVMHPSKHTHAYSLPELEGTQYVVD
jgi:hypothetical protein